MAISSKQSLETMTKQVFAVINYPHNETIDINTFRDNLTLNGLQFALIPHIDEPAEDGAIKTAHIHVFAESAKRHRLSWYINRFDDCSGLEVSIVDCISVFVANDKPGCIQYLIHKNNPEKKQYNAHEIVSNINGLEDYLNCEIESALDIFRLAEIVSDSDTILDVMYAVGLGRYAMYRNVINDMKNHGLLGSNHLKKPVNLEDEDDAV